MQEQEELSIGDMVQLNSGSPSLKVIALDGEQVEVEWRGETTVETIERTKFPRVCVRRAAVHQHYTPARVGKFVRFEKARTKKLYDTARDRLVEV